MRRISNQGGIFESNAYSTMYREGEFGWTITKAKVVTNSVVVRDNVSRNGIGPHVIDSTDRVGQHAVHVSRDSIGQSRHRRCGETHARFLKLEPLENAIIFFYFNRLKPNVPVNLTD